MDMDRVAKLAESIWRKRETVNDRMEELARYIYPDRAGFTRTLAPGAEERDEIWDGTPEDAAQMLAAALGSLLTNPSGNWFTLEYPDAPEQSREAGLWLNEVTRRMLAAFADPRTGFQNEVNAFYLDLPVFGWAVFWSEYRDGEGLRFRALPPSQCAIAEDAAGRVDSVARRYTLTAAQMVEEFGDAVSDAVRSAVADDSQKDFEITHLVMPRSKLPPDILSAGEAVYAGWHEQDGHGLSDSSRCGASLPAVIHPFVSIYFETHSKKLLHQGGYFELPFQSPRWSKRSGEEYGRGPGHAALPDIRVLNTVAAAQLTAAEKQADPPLLVPDDSVLGKINTHSGGITYYSPGHGDKIAALPVAVNLDVMELIISKRQDAIRSAFLNDRIQLAGDTQMTATEFLGREKRQMLVLGPVLGRLQSEFLGPLVDRTFALLYRAGKLPAAPQEMRGRELQARYVSPISRALRQNDAEGFATALGYIAPIIQHRPETIDNFDADVIVRDSQSVFGYPQKYLRPTEDVARERAELAELAERAELGRPVDMAGDVAGVSPADPASMAVTDATEGEASDAS
ncbi:head-tail connector protein [Desulfovibrio sp. OttesenSCG-928-I05]|nr:head-tail connector protein [Desulfovibrio sp. OttesenSCG-928-I05]